MVTYLYIGKGRKIFFAKKGFMPILFFIKKDSGAKIDLSKEKMPSEGNLFLLQ